MSTTLSKRSAPSLAKQGENSCVSQTQVMKFSEDKKIIWYMTNEMFAVATARALEESKMNERGFLLSTDSADNSLRR